MVQRMSAVLLSTIVALAILLAAQPVTSAPAAQTVYVDPVHGNDASGTGSAAAPWRSIKRALQSAATGDIINALPGMYSTATGEVFPINGPPGVKLIGAGRDKVIIQGQSSQPVIYVGSASADFYSDTVISGVTVRGGSEGIYLYSSQGHVNAVTLVNLRAINNTNGIRVRTGEVYQNGATVTPLISNTEALSNTNQGFYFGGYGYFSASSVRPEVIRSTARGNGAHGLYIESAAVSTNGTTVAPHLIESDFSYNHGSGVYATGSYEGWARPQIERSTLVANGAQGFTWAQGINGGNTATALTNTLIARNQNGGVYLGDTSSYVGGSTVRFMNTTIADNAPYGIFWVSGGAAVWPQVVNTILWNRAADDLQATNGNWSSSHVQYSDIEDGDFNGQSGNFSTDPLLDESYHLMPCSPAIDAGTLNGAPPLDFDGEPRSQGPAPDVGMDELDTLCVLRSAKTVSASQARYGDLLTYTLQITNVTPLTTISVVLTDVLPTAVSYMPASLVASQGAPKYQSGTVTWEGDLVPSSTLTISLAARVARGNTTIVNHFTAQAVGYGIFKSGAAATQVGPITCYLPSLYRDYCRGPLVDDFSNPASGWPIVETTGWSNGYTGGEYRFYAKRSAFGAVTRDDADDEFTVEVNARQVSAVNGSFGIVFYLDDAWNELFTFEIYPATQEWALFQYSAGNWVLWTHGHSPSIKAGSASNRLGVKSTTYNNYIALSVNGDIFTNLIYPAATRRVGLTATSDGAGFDVRFDNYQFVSERCPDPAAAQLSSAAVTHGERYALDQLPAVWQDRLRTRNSAAPRIEQGRSPLSEWAR